MNRLHKAAPVGRVHALGAGVGGIVRLPPQGVRRLNRQL